MSSSHAKRQTQPVENPEIAGLEIIDAGLERQGMVPVDEITITDSGLAIYRIKAELTDGSLEKAIENKTLDWVEATKLTLDALKVVSEMHADHEIKAHGDINPSNILIDHVHDTAAISGFYNTVPDSKGLAIPSLRTVLIGSASQNVSENMHLDPSFSAPEVINGAEPSSSSDVYEGARTLLYALHGRPIGNTVQYDEFMDRLEPVQAPDLSLGFPKQTPNNVRFIIQEALQPEPSERPSMAQLIDGVEASL